MFRMNFFVWPICTKRLQLKYFLFRRYKFGLDSVFGFKLFPSSFLFRGQSSAQHMPKCSSRKKSHYFFEAYPLINQKKFLIAYVRIWHSMPVFLPETKQYSSSS